MLSDNVTVKTRYYDSNEIIQIGLEKSSEYVVTSTEKYGYFFGTEIKLDYKKFFEVFKDEENLIAFIEEYFYSSIPIFVRNDDMLLSEKKTENSCKKIIESIVKESIKGRYEQLDCSRYSDGFTGYIQVKRLTKIKTKIICNIPYSNVYIFNPNKEKFEFLGGENADLHGYYYLIKYAKISNTDYLRISKGKKNTEKIRNEIIALSREQNNDIVLCVSKNETFNLLPYFSSGQD